MTQLFNRLRVHYERRSAVFSPIGNGLVHNGFADAR
jgi:hypothetical protein